LAVSSGWGMTLVAASWGMGGGEVVALRDVSGGTLAASMGVVMTLAASWGMEGEAGEAAASSDCFIVGLGGGCGGKSQGRGTC